MPAQPLSPASVLGRASAWALAAVAVFASSGAHTSPTRPDGPPVLASTKAPPEPTVTVRSRPGETLNGLLRRGGLADAEAVAALATLAEAVDVTNARGLTAVAEIEATDGRRRLLRLRVTGGAAPVALERSDGRFFVSVKEPSPALAARPRPALEAARPRVVAGPMEVVLYGEAAGAPAAVAGQAARLLARDIDFARDVRLGDAVRVVVQGDRLLYAELDGRDVEARFYRHQPRAGAAVYLNAEGRTGDSPLLRTPVADARVTSGFGPRRHPILGYTRQHQGVDFAASTGAPVIAAAGGRVLEAGWKGGYGRVVRIAHADGVETLYGHLSRWPAGLAKGAVVRQGAVIGYVGSSGLATGPHLHYEVSRAGRRVDPRSAIGLSAPGLTGPALAAFETQRREIDALLDREPPGS